MKMKIITNALESGDWIIIKDATDQTIWSGHSIRAMDLVDILASVGMTTNYIETDDEEIQDIA